MAGPTKRKKTERQIVAKIMKVGGGEKEEVRRRWGGRGRFIIGALSVISSCTMGLEISMEKWLNSNHIKLELSFSVLLSLYRMLQYVCENLMCSTLTSIPKPV